MPCCMRTSCSRLIQITCWWSARRRKWRGTQHVLYTSLVNDVFLTRHLALRRGQELTAVTHRGLFHCVVYDTLRSVFRSAILYDHYVTSVRRLLFMLIVLPSTSLSIHSRMKLLCNYCQCKKIMVCLYINSYDIW